jgi:heterodisulfide reductase subunit A-like polyferredoxin
MSEPEPTILYCHCQYAQVVPKEVKEAVLRRLCESGVAFDAVADLCEMAARKDPALKRIASCGAVKIAACFPRAVKGLFHQCDADLDPKGAEILNMRTQSADEIAARLAAPDLQPNVPGKTPTEPPK